MAGDHRQISCSSRIRVPQALLPVLQGSYRNSESLGKLALRHLQARPECLDIRRVDFVHAGPCFRPPFSMSYRTLQTLKQFTDMLLHCNLPFRSPFNNSANGLRIFFSAAEMSAFSDFAYTRNK